MTNYVRKRIDQLSPGELAGWKSIQEQVPDLDSPFFRPEFAESVAAIRDDVRVVVLEEEGTPVGFFPFRKGPGGAGRPVGGTLSGREGLVSLPETVWDVQELLRASRLTAWEFQHAIPTQTALAPFRREFEQASFLDLSRGFEAYRAARRKTGSHRISKVFSRGRRLAKALGPLEFVLHSEEPEVLDTLLDWRRDPAAPRRAGDVWRRDWAVAYLKHTAGQPAEKLSTLVSVVCAGHVPVAISCGLRSRGTLHVWSVDVDRNHSDFDPDLLLVVMLAQECERAGIRRIDMGPGNEPFQTRLVSDSRTLAVGKLTQASKTDARAPRPEARPIAPLPVRVTQGIKEWFSLG